MIARLSVEVFDQHGKVSFKTNEPSSKHCSLGHLFQVLNTYECLPETLQTNAHIEAASKDYQGYSNYLMKV